MKIDSVPAASDKYVKELDGMRAVAIMIVVCAHYRIVPVPGGFGVTLFFFLSGYLITTLFYAEYHSDGGINIFKFYLRRWLRLTPPLIISVILAVSLYHVSRVNVGGTQVPLGTTMAALLYYTNYYDLAWMMEPSRVIPFGVCWSLAVEEHFYLLWPLIVKTNIQKTTTRLLAIIIILCATVMVWRFIAHYVIKVQTDYTGMATDCRIDSILYGALLRVLFESPWAAVAVNICKARVTRIAALLVLLVCFAVPYEGFRETVRYSLQGIALMPVFTAILVDRPDTVARRILSSPPMVLVGRLSYSIYLFHLMARTPAEVIFGSPYRIESTISGLILTGALSYVVFIFVELPIARIRHALRGKERIVASRRAIQSEV